ncbi:MAG: hypothetical protein KW804_02050 [Candidatus Doudnabacteria bacterium]|nr:hypothetical protein [Candidatus Doudnabacteria bacterium]
MDQNLESIENKDLKKDNSVAFTLSIGLVLLFALPIILFVLSWVYIWFAFAVYDNPNNWIYFVVGLVLLALMIYAGTRKNVIEKLKEWSPKVGKLLIYLFALLLIIMVISLVFNL